MCGICGVVSANPEVVFDPPAFENMRDLLWHRGPDDCGSFLEPGVALGSRRLAILDLSPRGHMPMITADGRYVIVYNGEVYNFRELRTDLQSRGHVFQSETDTEVVLKLFVEFGQAALHRMNGMFAFAIWDRTNRQLVVARDRLGIKPLYYRDDGKSLSFASEAKALFSDSRPEFASETLEEMLCFRYVAGDRTPYRGVRRLLPGHLLTWRPGSVRIDQWWNLGERARDLREDAISDPAHFYRQTFDEAVALRRISDVPVGVLLSGGLDSSSVAASMGEHSPENIATFTVRFEESYYDEGPLAREVAEKWDMQFNEWQVDRGGLIDLLEDAAWHNDEPLAHGNDLFFLAISRFAKPKVTVLLSGEGADETLGGYVRYRPLQYPNVLNVARAMGIHHLISPAGGRAGKLGRFLNLGGLDQFVLYNASTVFPDDLTVLGLRVERSFPYRERVLRDAQRLYPHEPFRQAMFLDQHTFLCSLLDRNDRMTMGASIECRVPFLDYRLVERLAAMDSQSFLRKRVGKWLLRAAVGNRLPESIRRHRKWGFAVPWTQYYRSMPVFREMLDEIPSSPIFNDSLADRKDVRGVIDRFYKGDESLNALVSQMAAIHMWHRACIGNWPARRHAVRPAPTRSAI